MPLAREAQRGRVDALLLDDCAIRIVLPRAHHLPAGVAPPADTAQRIGVWIVPRPRVLHRRQSQPVQVARPVRGRRGDCLGLTPDLMNGPMQCEDADASKRLASIPQATGTQALVLHSNPYCIAD